MCFGDQCIHQTTGQFDAVNHAPQLLGLKTAEVGTDVVGGQFCAFEQQRGMFERVLNRYAGVDGKQRSALVGAGEQRRVRNNFFSWRQLN